MPTTPYAKLLIRVNGGAPQSGGITAATGNVIQLEAESTVGWSSASRWEIYGFPSGFALPAGWLSETTGGHTVYYYLGNTPPPAFTLGPWGKYMPALHVNGGGGERTDTSTALSVPSPSGLLDLGHLEEKQFGGTEEGWARDQRANLRIFETGLGGGGAGVPTSRTITAGDGLTGGGDLTANRTLAVQAADGSISVGAGGVRVGAISDAQHGALAGGSAHAVATTSAAGFMSSADKTALDSLVAGSVPTTREIVAGAGLTGGGTLAADRTINVVAGDASIVVAADSITVGVISDAQHGNRAGGALHAQAVAGGAAGFMSGADKGKLDNATKEPVADTLALRDGDAGIGFAYAWLGGAPATTGDLRVSEGFALKSRNAAAEDLTLLEDLATDGVAIGDTTYVDMVRLRTSSGGTTRFDVGSSEVARIGATYVSLGTNPASAGYLRGPNDVTLISARNPTNTGDLTCLTTDNASNVYAGPSDSEAANLILRCSTGKLIRLRVASAEVVYVDSANWRWSVPNVFWGAGVSAPTITQTVTPGATGQTMSMIAQQGATTGGGLLLSSGTGASAAGDVTIRRGSVVHVTHSLGIADHGVRIKLPATDPTAVREVGANSDGYLRVYVGGSAKSVTVDPTVTAIKIANYTASINEVVRVEANDPITITLPTAVGNTGRSVWVKEVDEGPETITVQGTGGQLVESGSSYAFAGARAVRRFMSDGANWMVV